MTNERNMVGVESQQPISQAEARIIAHLRAIQFNTTVVATIAMLAALAAVIIGIVWAIHFAERPG
jgi:hypothetical protein